MIVNRALIPNSIVETRQFRLVAVGRPHSHRCAIGECLPGFPQLFSYPDWKLKTREELELGLVQAATMTMTTCLVGCSKRSPTERKLKRMITVLHKMSKSKGAPQKKNESNREETK